MSNVFADFMVNSGLYEKITVTEENINQLIELVSGKVNIDVFCTGCQERRVFRAKPVLAYSHYVNKIEVEELGDVFENEQALNALRKRPSPETRTVKAEYIEVPWRWKGDNPEAFHVLVMKYHCAMDPAHRIDYIFLNVDDDFIKIGQYPSIADLSFPELKQYKGVIDANDMKELRRAIGLHAQGIGVGSYVYLRRILERLVDKAKTEAVNDGAITDEAYAASKVTERIKMLKGYLPSVLADNAQIYGIVSKGIHELSEDECIKYFPILQSCIIMILNMWEQERKQREEEKLMRAALSKIAAEITQGA